MSISGVCHILEGREEGRRSSFRHFQGPSAPPLPFPIPGESGLPLLADWGARRDLAETQVSSVSQVRFTPGPLPLLVGQHSKRNQVRLHGLRRPLSSGESNAGSPSHLHSPNPLTTAAPSSLIQWNGRRRRAGCASARCAVGRRARARAGAGDRARAVAPERSAWRPGAAAGLGAAVRACWPSLPSVCPPSRRPSRAAQGTELSLCYPTPYASPARRQPQFSQSLLGPLAPPGPSPRVSAPAPLAPLRHGGRDPHLPKASGPRLAPADLGRKGAVLGTPPPRHSSLAPSDCRRSSALLAWPH